MSHTTRELISHVRSLTGAALKTCKKALDEAKGNVETAIEAIKKMGHAVAAKKADRSTAEGLITTHVFKTETGSQKGGMLELQCETDFVSKNEIFKGFAQEILNHALISKVSTLDELLSLKLPDGQTVEEAKQALVAQVGENIRIAHYSVIEADGELGSYVHNNRCGTIVAIKGGNSSVARTLAVHIFVSRPENISNLLDQDFYQDPSRKISQYLGDHQTEVLQFVYHELGGTSYSS